MTSLCPLMTLKFGKSPPSVLNPDTLYINKYPLISTNSGNVYCPNSSPVTFSSNTTKRSPVMTLQPLSFSSSTRSFRTSTEPQILARAKRNKKSLVRKRRRTYFMVVGKCSGCASCSLHRGVRRTDTHNAPRKSRRQVRAHQKVLWAKFLFQCVADGEISKWGQSKGSRWRSYWWKFKRKRCFFEGHN